MPRAEGTGTQRTDVQTPSAHSWGEEQEMGASAPNPKPSILNPSRTHLVGTGSSQQSYFLQKRPASLYPSMHKACLCWTPPASLVLLCRGAQRWQKLWGMCQLNRHAPPPSALTSPTCWSEWRGALSKEGHLQRAPHCLILCPASRQKPPFLGEGQASRLWGHSQVESSPQHASHSLQRAVGD